MTPPLSPDELERLARKRAGAKLGWYVHAAFFVGVNLLLLALSRYDFGQRPWSVFPFFGWGVGLALHGVAVFVIGKGSGLRERMVQQEREALQRQQNGTPR